MANDLPCSDCKGDVTRCECHRKRPYFHQPSHDELRLARMQENERELGRLKTQMRRLAEEEGII